MAERSATPGLADKLRGKGGLIAFAIVIVLAFVAFLEMQAPPPRQLGESPGVWSYVGLRSQEVDRFEIRRQDEDVIALAKQGDEWRITQPIQAAADSELVTRLLTDLLDSPIGQDGGVTITTENQTQYGLNKPSVQLVLHGGGKSRTLRYANSVPQRPTERFAVTDEVGKLFTLANHVTDELQDNAADEFRNRRLVRLDADDVRGVTIQSGSETTELRRDGNTWKIVRPVDAVADESAGGNLASAVVDLEADEFVESNPADLAKYGLDRPRLTITATGPSGEETVAFGSSAGDDGGRYARRQGENVVVTVADFLFDDVNKQYAELRNRNLLTFENDDVTRISLVNPSGAVELEKQGGAWQMLKPRRVPANANRVADLLFALGQPADAAVEENAIDLAKYGLDKPQVTAIVSTRDGRTQSLFVGRSSARPGHYVRTSTTANLVLDVSMETVQALQVSESDLTASDPPPPAAP